MPVGKPLASDPWVRSNSTFPLSISDIKHDQLCNKKVPEGQLALAPIAVLKGGQCVHPSFSFLDSKIETQIGKKVVTVTIINFNLKVC